MILVPSGRCSPEVKLGPQDRQAWPDTGQDQPYAVSQFIEEGLGRPPATFHRLGTGPIAPQNVRPPLSRIR